MNQKSQNKSAQFEKIAVFNELEYEEEDILVPHGDFAIGNINERNALLGELFDLFADMKNDDLRAYIVKISSDNIARDASSTSGNEYRFLGEFRSSPLSAPELWPGARNTDESILLFISRVYDTWIGYGMTRADLEKIDPPALAALRAWERRNGRWLVLPTTKEHNDALIKWVESVDAKVVSNALPPAEIRRVEKLKSWRLKFATNTLN
jgi:hypothetical protein